MGPNPRSIVLLFDTLSLIGRGKTLEFPFRFLSDSQFVIVYLDEPGRSRRFGLDWDD